jgi:ketosteroid isomerase-like protein
MSETVPTSDVAVVRGFYDKLSSEETFPEALALLDEDFVVHSPPGLPWGGEYRGQSGFIDLITRITNMLAIGNEVPMQFLDAGDLVVVKATGRYTSHATGKSAVTPIVELFTVRDGKLIDMDIYYKDPEAVFALSEG